MDELWRLAASADTVYKCIGLAIVGLIALVWKFGNKILDLLERTHVEVRSTNDSIQTNHGSKSLGDAIDKLTESQLQALQLMRDLRTDLNLHLVAAEVEMAKARDRNQKVDQRLKNLEEDSDAP